MKESTRSTVFKPTLPLSARQAAETPTALTTGQIVFFLILHFFLAFASQRSSAFSTVYALGIFGLGFLWLIHYRTPEHMIYLTGYITGAELIWRGTNANIFYESGKYVVGIFLILSMLKYQRIRASNKWPLIYFVLLLPSILVLPEFDRQTIAFNLSGPFALAMATMFFSTIQLDREQLKRLLLAILAPAVGLGFLAAFSALTTAAISFGNISNLITSAEIGPNQVSSILGLGAIIAYYYVLLERENGTVRFIMIVITIWLIAQTALTYSRGGLWTALGAMLVSSWFLIRERNTRTIFIISGIVIIVVMYFFILPALQNFTGGTLSVRLTDLDTSGRIGIAQSDLVVLTRFPLLGVGPGQSDPYHELFYKYSHAHTEYTRLLAEHGSLGLAALLILLSIALNRFIKKASLEQKGYRVLLTSWALLFMVHSAMRLVAPSFVFGMASATIKEEGDVFQERIPDKLAKWNAHVR